MRTRTAALFALIGLLPACADDATSLALGIVPTSVAVDPTDFLGEVRCSANPGGMQSYVATLFVYDSLDDDTPFRVGSSQPTSCARAASFRNVILPGRFYTAEIDGYDVAPEFLFPFGGVSGGARQMLDLAGAPRTPRWTTNCGQGPNTAAVATDSRLTYVRSCQALTQGGASGALSLAAGNVLGDDPCSVASTYDVEPLNGGLPAASGVACDADALLFEGLAEGAERHFYVRAATTPASGALCTGQAQAGETTPVLCDALSTEGAARVDLGSLGAAGAPLCPEGGAFDILEAGEAHNKIPLPCGTPAFVEPLAPGVHDFVLPIYDAAGAEIAEAACAVTVEPGRRVDATCAALP